MSKLHEMKVKHREMSLVEKMACTCEMCKKLNVNKLHRKIETIKPEEVGVNL